jgi:hypothetical protein
MNRIARVCLTAFLALFTISAAPLARTAITRSAVQMRAAASPRAPVIARLARGAPVRVQECAKHWCRVRYRRVVGYLPERSLDRRAGAGRCGELFYRNVKGHCVRRPEPPRNGRPPVKSTARCWDGDFSHSESKQGTCSNHGGTPT